MTRINDNAHYLSQVWLGWWMAFLACESVNKTESQKGPMVDHAAGNAGDDGRGGGV